MLGQVIEVLAQPDPVMGARAGGHDGVRAEPRWVEDLWRLMGGPVEQDGQARVPVGEGPRATLEGFTGRREGDWIPWQLGHRVCGEAQSQRPADQPPELLFLQALGSTLAEESPQRVIQARAGRDSALSCLRLLLAQAGGPLHGFGQE